MGIKKISFLQQSILSLYNLANAEDVIYFTLGTILKFINTECLSLLHLNDTRDSYNLFWKNPYKNKIEIINMSIEDIGPLSGGLTPHKAAMIYLFKQFAEQPSFIDAVLDSSSFFPLTKDGEEIGSLQVSKGQKQTLGEKEEQFFITLLAHTAQALNQIKQQQQKTCEVSRITTISNFNEILYGVTDVKQASDLIVDLVSSIMRVNRVSLLLFEPGSDLLNIVSGLGLDTEVIEKVKVSKEAMVTGEAIRSRRSLLVTDIEKFFPIRNRPNYYNNSFITFPIIHQNRLMGTLNISNKADRSLFNHEDLARLSELVLFIARSLYSLISTAELEKLAITDELSQLYNRRYFYQRLTEEFLRAKRYSGCFAIMMLDFDGLKEINDIHGHLVGDQVIKKVGDLIQKSVRDIDCVARFGGDEFTIICPKANAHQAQVLAERILKEVTLKPLEFENGSVLVRISCGVASYPEDDTQMSTLVKKSDEALYQAKAMGGNRVCLFGTQSKEDIEKMVDKFSRQILNSPLKVRIGSFFVQNPSSLHHVGDLGKILNISPNWLRNDLEELINDHVLDAVILHEETYYTFSKDEHMVKLIDQYFKNYMGNGSGEIITAAASETNNQIDQEMSSREP